MFEDMYKHLVFLGFVVSAEEDSSGRTHSSMVASPSWLPVFQKQMKQNSICKQIGRIEKMIR